MTKQETAEMYRLAKLVHRLKATREQQTRYQELCRTVRREALASHGHQAMTWLLLQHDSQTEQH